MIRAKVNIETSSRAYKPGEIVKEGLRAKDIDFLRRRGFIIIAEEEDDMQSLVPEADGDENAGCDPVDGICLDLEGAAVFDEADYKDEDALQKMTKEEITVYAEKIGLQLDGGRLKADLINAVLNYQEERMAE